MGICRKGELTVVLCLIVGCHGLVMMWALPVEGSPGKPSHGKMVLNHCAIAPSAGDEEQAGPEHRLVNLRVFHRRVKHCHNPKAIPPNPTGFRLRWQNLTGPNPTPLCTQLFTWGTRHNNYPSLSLPCHSLQQPGTPARTHSWLVTPESGITRATGGLCPAGLCCHHCSTSFTALSQLQIPSE